MPQLNYDQYPAKGFSGLIADSGNRNINSHASTSGGPFGQHSDENIIFGHGVVLSDIDGVGVSIPLTITTPTAIVAGIATATQKTEGIGGGDQSAYNLGDAVNVMTKGRVWVELVGGSADATAGAPVYITTAATTPVGAGAISATATDNLEVPSARFVGSASAGELVIVEINLP